MNLSEEFTKKFTSDFKNLIKLDKIGTLGSPESFEENNILNYHFEKTIF